MPGTTLGLIPLKAFSNGGTLYGEQRTAHDGAAHGLPVASLVCCVLRGIDVMCGPCAAQHATYVHASSETPAMGT